MDTSDGFEATLRFWNDTLKSQPTDFTGHVIQWVFLDRDGGSTRKVYAAPPQVTVEGQNVVKVKLRTADLQDLRTAGNRGHQMLQLVAVGEDPYNLLEGEYTISN